MTQQTAVEWLVSQQKHNKLFDIETIEQAKAMEKDQIKNAYWNGTIDISKEDALAEAEDFYNSYYNI